MLQTATHRACMVNDLVVRRPGDFRLAVSIALSEAAATCSGESRDRFVRGVNGRLVQAMTFGCYYCAV